MAVHPRLRVVMKIREGRGWGWKKSRFDRSHGRDTDTDTVSSNPYSSPPQISLLTPQFLVLNNLTQSARCTNTNTNGPTPPTTPHHINPPCPCTRLNTRSQFICIQFDTLTLEEQRDRFHMSLACHVSYGYASIGG